MKDMDGYKRFTRVEKIKFLLDNSYIKGGAKEYLNSKFYFDLGVTQQFSELYGIWQRANLYIQKKLKIT